MSQHRPLFLAAALSRALLLLVALALLVPSLTSAQVIDTLPRIGTQPQSATIGRGANVRFTVSAANPTNLGGTIHYQWFAKNTPVGTDAATLNLSNVQSGENYYVRVRNSMGTRTSNIVPLTVVQGGMAPLGGRPIALSTASQQPSVAMCGEAHVAWREWNASGSSNIHVAAWNGTQWTRLSASPQRAELNYIAGTIAKKPVLRVHPQGLGSGGIADNSAVAWIESGQVKVKYWNGSASRNSRCSRPQSPFGQTAHRMSFFIRAS